MGHALKRLKDRIHAKSHMPVDPTQHCIYHPIWQWRKSCDSGLLTHLAAEEKAMLKYNNCATVGYIIKAAQLHHWMPVPIQYLPYTHTIPIQLFKIVKSKSLRPPFAPKWCWCTLKLLGWGFYGFYCLQLHSTQNCINIVYPITASYDLPCLILVILPIIIGFMVPML